MRRPNSFVNSSLFLPSSFPPPEFYAAHNHDEYPTDPQPLQGCSDPDAHSATQEDFDVINMTLLIKDKHSISGRAYHEMASVFKTMRKHY